MSVQGKAVGLQMAELLSEMERLRASSEQCSLTMQSRIETLDAKLKLCEGKPRQPLLIAWALLFAVNLP